MSLENIFSMSLLNDTLREQIKKMDHFVIFTNGEISFDSCLENPEMLSNINLPGYVAFAERLRFFQNPKPLVNVHVKNVKVRGPILFRKLGKETPVEERTQERVTFHFDRIAALQTPPSVLIRPLALKQIRSPI